MMPAFKPHKTVNLSLERVRLLDKGSDAQLGERTRTHERGNLLQRKNQDLEEAMLND